MAANTNSTTLIATTIQNFSNKIVDNVVTNNAVLYMMRKSGNYKVVSGGRSFVEQILAGTNSSFAARGKLDTIPTPNTDNISAAEYSIKVVSGSVVLPMLDVAMNSGSKEQLLEYTMAKKKEAQSSMEEILGDQMFNTSVGSNDFDSIPRLISETPNTDTDVGGISSVDNAFWRNYSHDTVVSAFNTAQAGINAMDTSLNAATKGKLGPKLIVTTSAIYTLYQLSLTNNQRYIGSTEMAGAGFKSLVYASDIPVVFDDNCPTGNMYFIDTESIKFKVLSQGDMKTTAFEIAETTLASIAKMYLFGNLTMDSRRTNAVIDSITG